MQESLLSQGANLMLFGMGTVCVFLALLVIVTTCMSKFMMRFFPEPQGSDLRGVQATTPQSSVGTVDSKTLTIIQSAITQHRKK